jgi:hypothetical protein
VALNVGATYFDGPSVALGAGTWYVSGHVTCVDTSNSANYHVKLWDGTTVIASALKSYPTSHYQTIELSGYITNPAGNVRISVRDTLGFGTMVWNDSTNGNDSAIYAIKIG